MKLKLITFFLIALTLLNLNFSAAAYGLQFADASKTLSLRWKKNKIFIALSTSFTQQNPAILPQTDVEGALRRSLATWEKVTDIKFIITATDKQSISPAGNAGDGVNLITIGQTPENLLLFGNTSDEISAQTRTFFNRQGFISEADIVLNPYQQFSTDGTIGSYDLESTLTHEIGHLLGLEHSSVLGATMQARQGKNGVYNLTAFAARTLSEDDITGIHALYGAKTADENCCGTVIGKITQSNSKTFKNSQVWAEDADSGKVIGEVSVNADGSFKFDSLEFGKFRFYAQDLGNADNFVSEDLGTYEVSQNKTVNISKKLRVYDRNFSLQYLGFNGQISDLAIPVNNGKFYTIYVGGKKLDLENIKIGFNSPYINVNSASITKHDYGSELSVLSCEIEVNSDTPAGDYSLYLKYPNGTKQFVVGGITVENFVNPLTGYVLPVNGKE